jgi:Uma2 family endonuclease
MDVKLSEEDVVQPDLLVVCKPEQIKRTHIEGSPSLVVEVLSKSSEKNDRHLKRELYARSRVGEYWIVMPFPSSSFPEVTFPLAPIFDFPLEDHEKELLRVKEPPGHYRAAPL